MATVEFIDEIYNQNPALNAFVPKIVNSANNTIVGNALFLRQALILWDLFLKADNKVNFVESLKNNDLILMGFVLGLNVSYYEGYQKLKNEIFPFSHVQHVLENLKELLILENAESIYEVIISLLYKTSDESDEKLKDLATAFDKIVSVYVYNIGGNTDHFVIELSNILVALTYLKP